MRPRRTDSKEGPVKNVKVFGRLAPNSGTLPMPQEVQHTGASFNWAGVTVRPQDPFFSVPSPTLSDFQAKNSE